MKKKLANALRKADPNLNIVEAGRRTYKATIEDWDAAGGATCPKCGREILKKEGPFEQCPNCFYKEKGVFINQITCPKCKREAVKVTSLSLGTQSEKITCPECGTYPLV